MKRVLVTIFLIAAGFGWPVVCAAADPAVKLPSVVQGRAGAFILVRAEGAERIVWHSMSPALQLLPAQHLADKRLAVLTAPHKGRYGLLAWPEGSAAAPAHCLIEVTEGPAPPVPPDPPPPPPPQPDPPKPVGPLYVIVIEETADAVATRGAYAAHTALRDRIKAKGHHWRIADKDVKDASGSTPAGWRPWVKRAEGKTLPYLLLVTEEGVTIHEGKLPDAPADLVKLLEAKGG